ncbi:nucleotide-binding domain-containing protein [Gymnopus androsaceus JB14]|uniref:Nucleotide-binding domain-containing protein n=1 Tax=Gymnopus androsaceus JB14 TaxID=1447944 RepID=A0A6A4HZJ0_9AGAR|nr:nucleotide-binding domain-containing protein [Gymnopus androsaceus JB14]
MPPSIVIIGSGVTGLSAAAALSRIYNVTIVARDLVGDNESHGWASPWAGAGWRPHITTSDEDIDMQKASFRYRLEPVTVVDAATFDDESIKVRKRGTLIPNFDRLHRTYMWKLAETDPDCGLKRVSSIDYFDQLTDESKIWYKDFIPGFKRIPSSDLPEGVILGFEYQTVVIHPLIYLQWLKDRLTASGVKFVRRELQHIRDVRDIVPQVDVVVNASGVGAKYLGGVQDELVEESRGQTMLVKTKETTVICRSGNIYAYSIPRLDGTAIIGGISQPGNTSTKLDPALRAEILHRARLITAPGTYPDKVEDLDIVQELVGIRPGRIGGVRVEKEVLTAPPVVGMKVVHAYGVGGTGYKYSAGVAKKVAELVDEFIYAGEVMLT